MGKKKEIQSIKVCVIGGEGVGKYSLSQQFAKGWIEPKETNNGPTADCPTKVMELKGTKYEVQLQVCKGTDYDDQIKDCKGIALVFSVTDKSSFSWAMTAIEKLQEKFSSQQQQQSNGTQETEFKAQQTENGSNHSIPVILVGNKIDDAKLSREVEEESAKSLCEKFSCAGFFETAAPCNAEVPKAFNCLLNEILDNMEGPDEAVKPSNACCVII